MASGNQQQHLVLQGPAASLSFEVRFRRIKTSRQGNSSQALSQDVAASASSLLPQQSHPLSMDANGKLKPCTEEITPTKEFLITTTIPWQAKVLGRAEVEQVRQCIGQEEAGSAAPSSRRNTAGDDHAESLKSEARQWLLNRFKGCIQSGNEHGSIVFTAVADDPYTCRYKQERKVSTSKYEARLLRSGATSGAHGCQARSTPGGQQDEQGEGQGRCSMPSSRDQLFFILADLAWDSPEDPLSPGPKVLLKARLTADGNLELEPPVELSSTLTHLPTKPRRHIFHDHTGAIYEYSIFLKTGESSAERQLARQQALWREHEQAHIERVAKKQMAKFKHLARATLFVWLEIVSGAGFAHDRVYVEFALCYPKSAWKLRGPSWVLEQQAATGCKDNDGDTVHVQGCTQVNKGRWVLPSVASNRGMHFVHHFAHPVEYKLEVSPKVAAHVHDVGSDLFPFFLFEDHSMDPQVHSMDPQLRSSPLGYGHLSLSGHPLGCRHSTVTTWRPMPSGRERVSEWFIGGGLALKQPGFVAYPHGAKPPKVSGAHAHPGSNRLALETEASGSLRVRTMCAVQHQELCVLISTQH